MVKQRYAYWDNLKAFLIYCVVLGHFILPISPKGTLINTTYYWIYSFHIPAFVFVSGYFSRSYIKKDNKEMKLTGFICLYIYFTFGIWLLDAIFGNSIQITEIVSTSKSQWYLMAMFFWYLLIPFASKIKAPFALLFFTLIGLLAGCLPSCGNFLAMSRTIVFFPLFLAGFHYGDYFPKTIKLWMKIFAFVLLIGCACFIYIFIDSYGHIFLLFYADGAYSILGLSNTMGLICRFIWYVVSMSMTMAIMCLIPTKHYIFTYIGERTLAIYIVHRFFRDILLNIGFYEMLNTELKQLLVCILVSFIVVLLASIEPISIFLNKFFHLTIFGEYKSKFKK